MSGRRRATAKRPRPDIAGAGQKAALGPETKPAPAPAPPSDPSILTRDGLIKYRDELTVRQADIVSKLQQLKAAADRLAGELNQVGGELKAVARMLGEAT